MGKSRKLNSYGKAIGKRYIFRILEKEETKYVLQAIGIAVLIAYLFYNSIFGVLTGVVIVPFWLKLMRQNDIEKRQSKLETEFKEYMNLIVSSLQAGYSLERAIVQAEQELKQLYPQNSILEPHIHIMNQKISMNIRLEKAFEEFAAAINIEEAKSLSDIISFAKRSGGDYGKNIKKTALKIEENLEIKQEIKTITTEKRLELKVMCVMPMGIIAYISLTSRGFIAPLYGNPMGAVLMTSCLLIYGGLIMLGRKIVDIKV